MTRYECPAFVLSGFRLPGTGKCVESVMTNLKVNLGDSHRNTANRVRQERL